MQLDSLSASGASSIIWKPDAEVYTVDIWLAVVIGITQLFLGGMGVYVSLRPPNQKHHWWWLGGFVAVGLVGVGLTGYLASIGSREQKRNAGIQEQLGKDIADTKRELAASRLEEARMSGHLQGIQTIMDNFSKSGLPGMKVFAQAVTTLGKPSSPPQSLDILCQNLADCPSKELSRRANELASELETLSAPYYKALEEAKTRIRAIPGNTPQYTQAQNAMEFNIHAQEIMAMDKYRQKYQATAVALRTVLVSRIGKRDTRMDEDYEMVASPRYSNIGALEDIIADLRKMAGSVGYAAQQRVRSWCSRLSEIIRS
jgi:hypothetical protein